MDVCKVRVLEWLQYCTMANTIVVVQQSPCVVPGVTIEVLQSMFVLPWHSPKAVRQEQHFHVIKSDKKGRSYQRVFY